MNILATRAALVALSFSFGGLLISPQPGIADHAQKPAPLNQSKVYLEVSPRGKGELNELLDALEASIAAGELQPDPVVVILHGPEASPFLRRNYLDNQMLVDRAAKLNAFNRIDMRMCETWMRNNGIGRDQLLPFIGTVPFAPEEVERLEGHGYLPYSTVRRQSPLL